MAITSIAAAGAAKTLMAVTISLHPAAAAHHAGHHGPSHITVKPGNTLSSIAKKEYGSAAKWPALWWTNRHSVHNPQALQVGQKLRVSHNPKLSDAVRHAAMGAIPVIHVAPAPAPAPAQTSEAPAAPAPAPAAPSTSTASYSGSGGFQSCVIQAESGGNAGAVNASSGAGGLYGFLPSTWHSLGHSGLPQDASVSEQNQAFSQEYAQSGGSAWSAYDGC